MAGESLFPRLPPGATPARLLLPEGHGRAGKARGLRKTAEAKGGRLRRAGAAGACLLFMGGEMDGPEPWGILELAPQGGGRSRCGCGRKPRQDLCEGGRSLQRLE